MSHYYEDYDNPIPKKVLVSMGPKTTADSPVGRSKDVS